MSRDNIMEFGCGGHAVSLFLRGDGMHVVHVETQDRNGDWHEYDEAICLDRDLAIHAFDYVSKVIRNRMEDRT